MFIVMLRFFRNASNVPVLTPYSLINAYWDIFFRFKVSHNGSNVIIATPALCLAYPKTQFLNNAEYSAIIENSERCECNARLQRDVSAPDAEDGKAIGILVKAQQDCEELYLRDDGPVLRVLPAPEHPGTGS